MRAILSVSVRLLLILFAFASTGNIALAAEPWKPFAGTYTGTATAQTDTGTQSRELTVKISEVDEGFRVEWDTSRVKPSGEIKRDSYSIDFSSSDREGIYASRMKPGLFGGRKPLDPMKGEPYVWGRIDGKTMTVYAMLITDTGDYEMQVYERTLVDGGMDLHFTRYRRSSVLSEVKALLKRQ